MAVGSMDISNGLASVVQADWTGQLSHEIIDLLHQEAPVETFAERLAQAEALAESATKSKLIELIRKAMAIRNRLDRWQQRESGMLAVIESARDLSSRLDHQE